MPESWPVFINTLLLAWLVRTVIVLQLAFRDKRCELTQTQHELAISKAADNQKLISIVIPAFNEKRLIKATLLSCIQSDYANKEIIVVDDGSTDGTGVIARKLADKHPSQRIKVLISRRNQGKTEALNLGLNQAKGDLIVTLDADTQLETEQTLSVLVRPILTNPEIAATTANFKIANPASTLSRYQAIEYAKMIQITKRAQSQTNTILILPGALSAFSKVELKAIGGFSKATLAEDADATMALLRQGYHICLNTSACGFTEVPTSIATFIKQRIRWRVGQWQCLWKHRGLARQSLAACFFYFDVVATNCLTAATPIFILLALWRLIEQGDWQSSAWASCGFIATDIFVTTTTTQLDKSFRTTSASYCGSLLFFAALNPVITWLSIIKLSSKIPITW